MADANGYFSAGISSKEGDEGRFRRSVGRTIPRAGSRGTTTMLPGGTTYTPLKQRTSAPACPFFVFADGRVKFNTFNGVIPTIDGDPINSVPAPSVTIADTGDTFVYLHPTFTLSATSDGYVYSSALDSVTIEVSSTEKTDPMGPSEDEFWVLLATFTDGIKIGRAHV